MTAQYKKRILKPKYIEKAKKIIKQKAINVGTTDNLRNKLGL